MGCVGSKPEESQAVKLCRERCTFLDEAVKQRYAFAQAHLLYMQSLKQIGVSLRDYFDQDLDDEESYAAAAPVLLLPKAKKGDLKKGLESSPDDLPHHVHSNSGSHLNFNTDSDDEEDGEGSSGSLHHTHRRHHSGNYSGSPLQPQRGYTMMNEGETLGYGGGFNGNGGGYNNGFNGGFNGDGGGGGGSFNGGGGGGYMHMNYMRKQPTPSVSYQQKPISPETVNMGQSSYFPYNYFASNNHGNSAPSSSSYQQFNGYSTFGGRGGGQYGGGQNGGYYGPQGGYGGGVGVGGMAEASSSKPPPPPPSPPRGSTWDFLNLFESSYNDRFYAAYTPSRDSVDVREAEGIPDLEEDYQHEVVKEVHGRQKFVGTGVGSSMGMGGGNGNYPKPAVIIEGRKKSDREDMYQGRSSAAENEGMEYEVHVVDKKVVDSENSEGVRTRGGGRPMAVSEAVRAIQVQFDRASEAANELASVLEVGKRQYRRKHGGYHVSSKMLHAIKPSVSLLPSASNAAEISGSTLTDIDEATGQSSKSLSATLQKLHIWEKKLYDEVKAEEKLRAEHDKKRQKLKHLDEKGAEAHKIEATRTLIRSLSTKIRIGIQIVDKISVTINSIRDDELCPQLNDLIHGFTRMWKCMLDCHHNQLLAIIEARDLDTKAAQKKPSHSNLEMMNQLVHELCIWTSGFSSWVRTQRKFIKSLNFWLLKCLIYEPEETADGPAPFSPGRIGAPSIFIICHQWSQAFDRISEKEVISSMRGLTLCVRQFWEQDKSMLRQSMDATKASESKVRELDREDQKMQKEIQTLDKKLVSVPDASQAVYQSDATNASLKSSLQLVFDSMERFTAASMKEYEELLQRIDEDKLAKQSGRES